MLNVPGYDPKEKFEFGVITSFAYPLEGSGSYNPKSGMLRCLYSSFILQTRRSSWQQPGQKLYSEIPRLLSTLMIPVTRLDCTHIVMSPF